MSALADLRTIKCGLSGKPACPRAETNGGSFPVCLTLPGGLDKSHVDTPDYPFRLPRPPDACRPSRAARPAARDRTGARGRALPDAGAREGAARRDGDDRAVPSDGLCRGDQGRLAGGGSRPARRRHDDVARQLRGGAALRRRRRAGGRRGDGRQGGERLRRRAPARPSCRDGAADGLLPVQQRRHRHALRTEEARRRARGAGRLRRASRQRLAGHLLVGQERACTARRTRCRSIPAPAR